MQAIWQIKTMKPLQHRIVWWLLDAGAVGKKLRHGWQKQCARQLSVHRITINRNVELMVEYGVLFQGEKKGEVGLKPEIFNREVDRTLLRIGD